MMHDEDISEGNKSKVAVSQLFLFIVNTIHIAPSLIHMFEFWG